jgi:hypothetical protein
MRIPSIHRGALGAGILIAVIVLGTSITARGTAVDHRQHNASYSPTEVSGHQARAAGIVFQTTRVFRLGPGRATRTFTLQEGSGVILRNQLTVRPGVRAFVKSRIPGVAGATVWTRPSRTHPSICRRHGQFNVCMQYEEWCPMPQATWHFRLVKLGGPAGLVRFDYVVGSPPRRQPVARRLRLG